MNSWILKHKSSLLVLANWYWSLRTWQLIAHLWQLIQCTSKKSCIPSHQADWAQEKQHIDTSKLYCCHHVSIYWMWISNYVGRARHGKWPLQMYLLLQQSNWTIIDAGHRPYHDREYERSKIPIWKLKLFVNLVVSRLLHCVSLQQIHMTIEK